MMFIKADKNTTINNRMQIKHQQIAMVRGGKKIADKAMKGGVGWGGGWGGGGSQDVSEN